MRTIILFLAVLLAGCNGSSDTDVVTKDNDSAFVTANQLPPNESTEVAALQAEVSALKVQVRKLQLIGSVHGAVSFDADRAVAPSFGPCTNLGVLQGRAGGSNAMTSPIETFQTCTGYEYSVSADDGSIQPLQVMYFDGAGCTGNHFADQGDINPQVAINGAVFMDVYSHSIASVTAGSAIQQVVAVSFGDAVGNCSAITSPSAIPLYATATNDVTVTGVPSTALPVPFQITSP